MRSRPRDRRPACAPLGPTLGAATLALFLLIASCGGGGGSGGGAGADDTGTGAEDTAGSAGGGGPSSALDPDPPWDEPPPPGPEEVAAAVAAIEADARAALGDETATELAAQAADAAPGARGFRRLTLAYAVDRQLDAARFLTAGAASTEALPATHASMAALAALDGRAEEAAVLARAAIGALGEDDDPARRRTLASAWNNLGAARRQLGEAAGAVHAYREATLLVPTDPTYRTGLAAAYYDAELFDLADLHVKAAEALARAFDPTLEDEPRGEAHAWAVAIAAAKDEATDAAPAPAFGEAKRREGALTSADFPAVGSSLAGMTVLAETSDGILMSPPPYAYRGSIDVPRPILTCREDDGSFYLTCPAMDVPGLAFAGPAGAWAGPAGACVAAPATTSSDTDCANLLDRVLLPDETPLRLSGASREDLVDDLIDQFQDRSQGAFASYTGGLLRGLLFTDMGGFWDPWLGRWGEIQERLDEGCDCSCTRDPGCPACWAEVAAACEEAYRIESDVGLHAIDLALRLEPRIREDRRTLLAAGPILADAQYAGEFEPMRDALASVLVDLPPAGAGIAPETIGARFPWEIREYRFGPTERYAECLACIPVECGGTDGREEGESPAEIPCTCLSIELLEACILADGTVDLRLQAGLVFGVRFQPAAGHPTLRVGFGLHAGLDVGAWSVGSVGVMTWWDAETNRWSPSIPDFSLGLKGYDGIKMPFGHCDSWAATAPPPEADDALTTLEVTPGYPDYE